MPKRGRRAERVRKRKERQQETQVERERRLESMRNYARKRREQETQDERERRLESMRSRAKWKRQKQKLQVERERRLKSIQNYAAASNMPKRGRCAERVRKNHLERVRKKREQETQVERERRLESMRNSERKRRERETQDERERRLESVRSRAKRKRQKQKLEVERERQMKSIQNYAAASNVPMTSGKKQSTQASLKHKRDYMQKCREREAQLLCEKISGSLRNYSSASTALKMSHEQQELQLVQVKSENACFQEDFQNVLISSGESFDKSTVSGNSSEMSIKTENAPWVENPVSSFNDFMRLQLEEQVRMTELKEIAAKNSMFYAHNLDGALDIIRNAETEEEAVKVRCFDTYGKGKAAINCKVRKILLSSEVFIYPTLLPTVGFTINTVKPRKFFFPSEDYLIALGLEQFGDSGSNYEQAEKIHHRFMICKTPMQIQLRIKNVKSKLSRNNPIKYYLDNKQVPQLLRTVKVFDPNNVKAPKDQPMETLPDWAQKMPVNRQRRKQEKEEQVSKKNNYRMILPQVQPSLFIPEVQLHVPADSVTYSQQLIHSKLPYILPKNEAVKNKNSKKFVDELSCDVSDSSYAAVPSDDSNPTVFLEEKKKVTSSVNSFDNSLNGHKANVLILHQEVSEESNDILSKKKVSRTLEYIPGMNELDCGVYIKSEIVDEEDESAKELLSVDTTIENSDFKPITIKSEPIDETEENSLGSCAMSNAIVGNSYCSSNSLNEINFCDEDTPDRSVLAKSNIEKETHGATQNVFNEHNESKKDSNTVHELTLDNNDACTDLEKISDSNLQQRDDINNKLNRQKKGKESMVEMTLCEKPDDKSGQNIKSKSILETILSSENTESINVKRKVESNSVDEKILLKNVALDKVETKTSKIEVHLNNATSNELSEEDWLSHYKRGKSDRLKNVVARNLCLKNPAICNPRKKVKDYFGENSIEQNKVHGVETKKRVYRRSHKSDKKRFCFRDLFSEVSKKKVKSNDFKSLTKSSKRFCVRDLFSERANERIRNKMLSESKSKSDQCHSSLVQSASATSSDCNMPVRSETIDNVTQIVGNVNEIADVSSRSLENKNKDSFKILNTSEISNDCNISDKSEIEDNAMQSVENITCFSDENSIGITDNYASFLKNKNGGISEILNTCELSNDCSIPIKSKIEDNFAPSAENVTGLSSEHSTGISDVYCRSLVNKNEELQSPNTKVTKTLEFIADTNGVDCGVIIESEIVEEDEEISQEDEEILPENPFLLTNQDDKSINTEYFPVNEDNCIQTAFSKTKFVIDNNFEVIGSQKAAVIDDNTVKVKIEPDDNLGHSSSDISNQPTSETESVDITNNHLGNENLKDLTNGTLKMKRKYSRAKRSEKKPLSFRDYFQKYKEKQNSS